MIQSAFPTIGAVHGFLESAAQEKVPAEETVDKDVHNDKTQLHHGLDAILLSHPFTDHAHPESLLDLSSTQDGPGDQARAAKPIKLLCTEQSCKAVAALLKDHPEASHRYEIHLLPVLPRDTDAGGLAKLLSNSSDLFPSGVKVFRLPAQEGWTYGPAWADLHSGIAILWSDKTDQANGFSSIIYSPHGMLQSSLPAVLGRARRRVSILAWDQQTVPGIKIFTGPVALGIDSILSFYPQQGKSTCYRPDTILRTHDENKTARGLIGKIISRKPMNVHRAEELLRDRSIEPMPTLKDLDVKEVFAV